MMEKNPKCIACGIEIDDTNIFEHDSNVCIKCGKDFATIFDDVDTEAETKILDMGNKDG
jgi:DNA-directed RNA polymerase subunit RPC12/RpoP